MVHGLSVSVVSFSKASEFPRFETRCTLCEKQAGALQSAPTGSAKLVIPREGASTPRLAGLARRGIPVENCEESSPQELTIDILIPLFT